PTKRSRHPSVGARSPLGPATPSAVYGMAGRRPPLRLVGDCPEPRSSCPALTEPRDPWDSPEAGTPPPGSLSPCFTRVTRFDFRRLDFANRGTSLAERPSHQPPTVNLGPHQHVQPQASDRNVRCDWAAARRRAGRFPLAAGRQDHCAVPDGLRPDYGPERNHPRPPASHRPGAG